MAISAVRHEALEFIHKTAGNPYLYSGLRKLMRGNKYRSSFVANLDSLGIEPEKVLDLGCGPGQMANFFPNAYYLGIDNNSNYINYAQKHSKNNIDFKVGDITRLDMDQFGEFDLVIAMGVLHHLSGAEAHSMLRNAKETLSDIGFIATTDCVRRTDNYRSANWMIDRDRGEFVRYAEEYENLINQHFANVISFDLTGTLTVPLTRAPYPQHMIVGSNH